MNRTAIFAHYDKNNKIKDYVLYYLQELSKIANNIIFVSDCDLDNSQIDKIKNITRHIIAKNHNEYDFGSYKYGYIYAKENNLLNVDELIFANDSCFGPLIPFEHIWDKMNKKECDYWGITENKTDVNFHIQSYFMTFKENVFKSNVFNEFILSVKKEENKNKIIEKYEIGLTETLIKNNFKAETYCSHLIDRKITQELVFKHNTPFIKKIEVLNLYPDFTKLICKTIFKRIKSNYNINLITNYTKTRYTGNFLTNLKIMQRLIIDLKLNKKYVSILGKEIQF